MIDFFPLKEYKKVIKKIIQPTYSVDSVLDISLESFRERGIETLLFDVDNTLLSKKERLMNLDMLNWLEMARSLGFNLYVISNNSSRRRIFKVCKQGQLNGLYFSMKPLPFSIADLIKTHALNTKTSVIIGDQVFTDIIAANLLGTQSVLVDPLDKSLSFFRTLQRETELYLLQLFN